MKRDMCNKEKHNAKLLRDIGFHIIYKESAINATYWAIHPKINMQYCLKTATDKAIKDYKKIIDTAG